MSSTDLSPSAVPPSAVSRGAGPGAVVVETTLDAPPDAVWRAVTTPAAFRFVTRGLVSLDGLDEVDTWGPARPSPAGSA